MRNVIFILILGQIQKQQKGGSAKNLAMDLILNKIRKFSTYYTGFFLWPGSRGKSAYHDIIILSITLLYTTNIKGHPHMILRASRPTNRLCF